MIIVDASDPEYPSQLEVTQNLLAELGAGDKPTLLVFNKCDKDPEGLDIPAPDTVQAENRRRVFISARTGEGIDGMCDALLELLHAGKQRLTFFIPNKDAGMLNLLYKNATVENVDYGPDGMRVTAVADGRVRGMMKDYIAETGENA